MTAVGIGITAYVLKPWSHKPETSETIKAAANAELGKDIKHRGTTELPQETQEEDQESQTMGLSDESRLFGFSNSSSTTATNNNNNVDWGNSGNGWTDSF